MTSKILQKGYLLVGRNELGEEKFLTHTNPFGWYSDYNYFQYALFDSEEKAQEYFNQMTDIMFQYWNEKDDTTIHTVDKNFVHIQEVELAVNFVNGFKYARY